MDFFPLDFRSKCLWWDCYKKFVLLLNLLIPWLFHDRIRKFHDLLVSNLTYTKGLLHVHHQIISLCWARISFLMVYFHFPWLLTFWKISMTSPCLKINHSNSMNFPGFSMNLHGYSLFLLLHHSLLATKVQMHGEKWLNTIFKNEYCKGVLKYMVELLRGDNCMLLAHRP